MPKKVFNKKQEKRCEYCVFGRRSEFSSEVMCRKKGITDAKDFCRKYKYDPLKREPERIRILNDFNAENFKI